MRQILPKAVTLPKNLPFLAERLLPWELAKHGLRLGRNTTNSPNMKRANNEGWGG